MLQCDRRFGVDLALLHERYKAFMREIHPDKVVMRPGPEKAELARQAASMTHAMSVLRDPAQRAKHLLDLEGHPLSEESEQLVSSAFLMHIMEAREAVDDAASLDDLRAVGRDNAARVDALSAALDVAFQSQEFDEAARLTAELQYLQRITTEIAHHRLNL